MALRRSAGSLVSLHPLVILVFNFPPTYLSCTPSRGGQVARADLRSRVQGGSSLLEDFF